MNKEIKVKGVLLQEIPYLGKKKILKILTEEEGLISLFANKGAPSPFAIAEWVYLKTSKEIYSLKDVSLIDPLLELKKSYEIICAAGSIAKDLLRTQLPEKKAPFPLTIAYLKKLPLNPSIMLSSFRLKLLQYEGLFPLFPDPSFTNEEWEELKILAFSQKFSDLARTEKAPHEKIESFFAAAFS